MTTPDRESRKVRMRLFSDDHETLIRAGRHLGERCEMGIAGVLRPDPEEGGWHADLSLYLPDDDTPPGGGS